MKNKILVGIGVITGLLVLNGIFNNPKPQVAGTQIEKPAATATPTAIPSLTPTPSPTPSPTPILTPSPTPKPTPVPTVKPQVQQNTYQAPVIDAGCGTYTNSAGQQVARPCPANDVPAGATARCRDGTYSYSQSRRGTCSSHGGVAQWL